MAAQDKPEFQPLLAPGRHVMTVDRLQKLCVAPFGTSASRERLMRSFRDLILYLEQNAQVCEVWVDRSFVTEKVDPGDVDVTVVVRAEVLGGIQQVDPAVAEDIFEMADDGRFSPDLHVYVIAVRPWGHPDHAALDEAARYWASWWSTSRELWVKGFVVIRVGGSDVALRLLP